MPAVERLDGLAEQIRLLHERCETLSAENAALRQEVVALRQAHQQHQATYHTLWEARMLGGADGQ